MRNAGLEEAQAGIKIAGRNINKLRYAEAQASLVSQLVKRLPTVQEIRVRSKGWEDPLEKGMATHSSILAWRIPWNIQSLGSQRVGHD